MKTTEHKPMDQPARHRTATDQFLLSKTDTRPCQAAPEERSLHVPAEMLAAFPHMVSGSDLLDQALARLDDITAFGAAAVSLDANPSRETVSSEIESTQIQSRVAAVVDNICQAAGGFWGQLGDDLFGCFFPAHEARGCCRLADEIQQNLAAHATVTIGIGLYPLLDYPKAQILDNALKALRHAAFFGPGSWAVFDAVSLNISGDEKYQAGDIEGAVREFESGLRLDPSNINLHNSLGVCFGVLKQYEKAWTEFDAAMQLNDQEVMAIYNAGLIRFLQGRHADALEYFLQAAALDEELYELALQTGKLYLALENPHQGRRYLERAAQLNPSSGPAFACLGQCYNQLQMTDEAIGAFKKAIRFNPFDSESLSALGVLYGEKGENPDIATLFCQKSIDLSPDNGLFHSRLGSLHLKYGRLQEALDAFQKASTRGSDAAADIAKIRGLLTVKAS